jgi:hypothetical protein
MLEQDQWDAVLATLVGVQFRGTERIASATVLDALGVPQDKEARQKAGKRIVTAMRRFGWTGPTTLRISAGNSLSGYWRLPCKPPGSRGTAEPFDGDVLSGELPEQLETVTRLGLRKLAKILRTPVDSSDGNLLRAQVTAAGIAINAQLRADEQRLKAKVQGDVLERLLAEIEKHRQREAEAKEAGRLATPVNPSGEASEA